MIPHVGSESILSLPGSYYSLVFSTLTHPCDTSIAEAVVSLTAPKSSNDLTTSATRSWPFLRSSYNPVRTKDVYEWACVNLEVSGWMGAGSLDRIRSGFVDEEFDGCELADTPLQLFVPKC